METVIVPTFGTSTKKKKTINNVLKPLNEKVRNILIDMYRLNPNTQVQHFIDLPKKWVSLSDFNELEKYINNYKIVNHRTIQKEEIIVDVDSENKNYGLIHLKALEKFWNELDYRRSQWDSGGDGYHVHFIFKQLKQIAEEDLADVKKQLIQYLCGPFMYMYKHKITNKYIFCKTKKQRTTQDKENLELCSHICVVNKKLIQIEWAPHRKGGEKKPFISGLGYVQSAEIEGKTPRIPTEVKTQIEENKKRRKAEYELRKWNTQQFTSSKYPLCIRFYLGEKINGKHFVDERDGTKRAMFHLISFFKHTKNQDELVEFISDWLEKISLGQGMVDSHGKSINKATIRSAINSNKGMVTCKARHEVLDELGFSDISTQCNSQMTN